MMSANFKKASDLIGKGEANLSDNPQKSVDALTKALSHFELLTDKEIGKISSDDFYTYYGWAYKYSFMALKALGQAGKAHLLAEACLRKAEGFEVDESMFKTRGYTQMRFSIRRAHIILAHAYSNAGDHSLAVEHIKKCFAIKSASGEHEDPFLYFYQSAAQVYYSAYQAQTENYQQDFFQALYQLEQQAKSQSYAVRIDAPQLLAFLSDTSYLAFKNAKPIEKLRAAPPKETWQQALKRFKQVDQLLQVPPHDEDERGWNELTIKPPLDEGKLCALEQKNNCQIPAPLRELLLQHGPFEMRDTESWNSLRLYSSFKEYEMPVFGGLQKMIDEFWGGRPEFTDFNYFTDEELALLNSRYFIFGHYVEDSNANYHLYFTSQGDFGSVYYDQDNWEKMNIEMRKLLSETDVQFTHLDGLISRFTDMAIQELIDVRHEKDFNINS
jgi:tetratricopeptide (TPR) repeat protein